MNKPAPVPKIAEMLRRLCLCHAERHLEELIGRSLKESMSNSEFLGLVLDHELAHRHENTVARLVRQARFPCLKTLDAFDWTHPTGAVQNPHNSEAQWSSKDTLKTEAMGGIVPKNAAGELDLAKPETLYVDGAYVGGPSMAKAVAEARELMGPAPGSPDRGAYTAEAFQVNVEQRYAICPAGKTSTQCAQLVAGETGAIT